MSPKRMVQKTAASRPEKKEPEFKDRSFLCDEDIRNSSRDGMPGYLVKVRLTSYRSLPLSCIEKIELSVDGRAIDPASMTFILNGYAHKLDELAQLSKNWWYILDYADLFVESSTPLAEGSHDVAGTMVTVEPYVTGGRFKFFYPSHKQLAVAAEL
jgi:hypothetical protein